MIPAEAIEAAKKVAFERYGSHPDAVYIRTILEAAAPYMLAGFDGPNAQAELRNMVYQVETQDFGGYTTRDAHSVADALFAAGYRKVTP